MRQRGIEYENACSFCSASFVGFAALLATATYTLSLHDALPILLRRLVASADVLVENFRPGVMDRLGLGYAELRDRKSTRLNSSHRCISYAVFCLKKKTPVPERPAREEPVVDHGSVGVAHERLGD